MNATDTLPPARHEPTDGRPGLVALTGAGLAVCVTLVLLVAAWIMMGTRVHHAESHRTGRRVLSFENGPHAITGVAQDWIAQDEAVREHLETYGWIDRGTGVVRIPIERAMQLLADGADAQNAGTREETAP